MRPRTRNSSLFPTRNAEPTAQGRTLPEGVRLYGMLMHGKSDRATLPGFAVIRFPNRDYDGFLAGGIDLFREFPDIVAERMRVLADHVVEDN